MRQSNALKQEQGLTKNQVIQELARSSHGKLDQYTRVTQEAAKHDPEFLAHLIAWNEKNGQIRDSRIALPVASLSHLDAIGHPELLENSIAHIAKQDPRMFLQALNFAKDLKVPGQKRLRRLVEEYLRYREERFPLWEGAVVQNRAPMVSLYTRWHVKPSPLAEKVLFKKEYMKGTALWAMANLRNMTDQEAAGAIFNKRLPFLPVSKVLGKRIESESLALALIQSMSPSEIVVNMKLLEKFGVKKKPALRAALEEAMAKVAASKKNVLKTSKAASVVKDEALQKVLHRTQERQLEQINIEGDWLVFGDCSSSMTRAIEVAKMIAAFLTTVVKGKVYLIFGDTSPTAYDVTGKTYQEIQAVCKYVRAGGATSIGCGLQYLLDRKTVVNGIALVTDGAENTPPRFVDTFKRYSDLFSVDIPVCLYWMKCEQPNLWNNNPDRLRLDMEAAGHDMQIFDLREVEVDYYSLPNLVSTMQTKRYGLLDAVMDTPLLTRKQVFV